ncbi:MAG: diguanylate cyclase [Burkholderiales bacterium]|nr:diguanylate cyclase [Burkholderiales bacterium]
MNLFGSAHSSSWAAWLLAAFGSLKLRITLGAIAGLVLGVGLSTAGLVRQAERDTLSAQRYREMSEAVRTAAVLSRRVVDLQVALQATAARLDAATLADDARLAAFMESQPVLRGLFANVFATGADGRMRVYADSSGVRRPEVNLSDRSYFKLTVEERRAIVSEPMPGRVMSEPVIVFTAPLLADARVYGVFGAALRLASRDLLADLSDGVDAEGGAVTLVTDTQGRILAHPSRTRLLQSLATEERLSQAFAHWVEAGSAAEPAGMNLAQADELVSAAGVAGTDWVVWRVVPQAELLAPLRAARRQALLWATVLIVIVSLSTLLLLWWLLRPLTQLEHRAQHLFDGSQDAHAGWPEVGGELGRLARVLRHVGAERAQLETFNTGLLQKLGSVMGAAPVGICFTRAQRFELVSAEFCRLFGRDEHEFVGQPTRLIYASNADFEAVGPQVSKAFAAGEPYVGEWEMLRADGTRFWACLRGSPVDKIERSAGTIWTINDIGEQVAERARLEWSATHDVLTGLANRKALDHRLQAVFEAMPRSVPAGIVMIDLDHFKPINDSAGHAAGDAVLKAVAAAIVSQVRASDLVVRIGGDEFALLLERCAPEVAMRIADNVRAAIAGLALPWQERVLRVGASVGVASLAAETRDAASWLADADAACYAAKASGRDTVRAAVRPMLRSSTVGDEADELDTDTQD